MNRTFLQILFFFNAVWGYKNLPQDTLAHWLKTSPPFDFVLIDVRTPGEIANTGMIGNDRCKPYIIAWIDDFKKYAPSLQKKQQIVLYCQSGNRAGQAATWLESQGYENVYNAGGWGTWGPKRDASLKLTIADTMAVSLLPAVSMKAPSTGTLKIASVAKTHNLQHSSTMVMINRSVRPVQSGRYYSADGRIIPMVSDQKRTVSLVVVSKRP